MEPKATAGKRQKFYFKFVTTPTADTPGTSLYLHFDDQRYFFGQLAEGTQRAYIQQGAGIKKLGNIFLTGETTWNNIGGLTGMILTLGDVQLQEHTDKNGVVIQRRPRLQLHGGPKLMHALACARRFVFRTGMPLSVHEAKCNGASVSISPSFEDDNIKVWNIPAINVHKTAPVLKKGRSGSAGTVDREQALREKTVTEMFDSDWKKDRLFEYKFSEVKLPAVIWVRNPETKELNDIRCSTMSDAPHLLPESTVLVRHPWPAAMVEELPPVDNFSGAVAMSYIVRGHPQRGKFSPQKAKELGVFGPARARLTMGEPVTLEDGTVISPDMVMNEAESGRGMAILDVPSEDYIQDLSSKLNQLKENGLLEGVEVMSWLLGPGVFRSKALQDLARSFPNIRHLVSSPDTHANSVAFDSSAASACRLAQINPGCFMKPVYDDFYFQDEVLSGSNFTAIQRGLIVDVSPKVELITTELTPLFDVVAATETSLGYMMLLPDLVANDATGPYDEIEFLTLGTGSAAPSKYRNVSATLVRIPKLGNYLFDAGENTLGQLRRMYSAEELETILCDLRMIWISHLHADHHLGTFSIIQARNKSLSNRKRSDEEGKLCVISESNMADYLKDYSSIEFAPNCMFVSAFKSYLSVDKKPVSVKDLSLSIQTLKTVPVAHCHGAQAISITFNNGFKFSYSGDCRPSLAFAEIGQRSHVLLHEATFDDGMEGDARAKKHSTTGEALGLAAAMNAQNVILTHFSQRYQKLPVLANIKVADQLALEEEDDGLDAGDEVNENLIATAMDETDFSQNKPRDANNTSANSALMKAAASMDMNICVAFDSMRVRYSQIPSLYRYYPAIERMFELANEISESKRAENSAINVQRKATKNPNKGKRPNSDVSTNEHHRSPRNVVKSKSDNINSTNTQPQQPSHHHHERNTSATMPPNSMKPNPMKPNPMKPNSMKPNPMKINPMTTSNQNGFKTTATNTNTNESSSDPHLKSKNLDEDGNHDHVDKRVKLEPESK